MIAGTSSRQSRYFVPEQLGLLRPQKSRWRAFAGGFAFQIAMCTILANIAFYEFVKAPLQEKFLATELYVPSLPTEPAVPKFRVNIPPPPVEHIEAAHKLTAPRPQQALPEIKVAQRLEIPQAEPEIALPRTPEMPHLKPQVRVNQFPGSSAAPTLTLPEAKVQTGGFGDPNGVPANPNAHGAVAIAQIGSFELPAGPGWGNGTGGSRGARGTVASAGFGNGVAIPVQSPGTRGGGIREGSFGDVTAAVPSKPKVVDSPRPTVLPVVVMSKPQPTYTSEARQKRIEGEVLLDVVFGANGQIRILRVVSGLGFGLDESAIKAAEKIVFKPATRNGQPIDSTARIHILFQLA